MGLSMQQICQPTYVVCRSYCFRILLSCILLFITVQYATNVEFLRFSLLNRASMNSSLVSTVSKFIEEVYNVTVLPAVEPHASTFMPESRDEILSNRTLTTSFSSHDAGSNNLTNFTVQNETLELPLCPERPPKLMGPLTVLMDAPSFDELEVMFQNLEPGGRFSPGECTSRHRVALIIPYRDRERNLRILLHNLHPMLMRQQLDYRIFLVEQYGDGKFNKGMLLNSGFVEALKQGDYQCFIFHDVDFVPEDDRNIYSCLDQPHHLSIAIDQWNYGIPYDDFFGGVCALSRVHMEKINGLSNEFWGWGGEDDDFGYRVKSRGYHITPASASVGRYKMLQHKRPVPSPDRFQKLYSGKKRYETDGLINLKYKLRNLELKKLYTWLLVEIGPLNMTSTRT